MSKILRRIDLPNDGGRAYCLLENEIPLDFYPSVSSILSIRKNSLYSTLENNLSKDELDFILKKAGQRGTAMHLFLENFMIWKKKGNDSDSCLLYTQRKSVDSLLYEMNSDRISLGRTLFYNLYHSGIFDNIKKVIFTERFLFSEKYRFAGTSDFCYLDNDNKRVLVDYKSASGPRDKETIDKYKCQVAAYSIAFEEFYGKPIDRGEIWLSYNDDYEIFSLDGNEMMDRKKEFLDLTEEYLSMWNSEPFEKIYKI